MVNEGIVLGHRILVKGIEVDRAKIDAIDELPPPTTIKGIRSFIRHVGFYRRFIKDFFKISKPLCNLLIKKTQFQFDEECGKAFFIVEREVSDNPYSYCFRFGVTI